MSKPAHIKQLDKNHPLAKRHFKRVITPLRSNRKSKKLQPIWAIAFLNRGRLLVPAGRTSVMVMSSHPGSGDKKAMIEVTCLTCTVDHENGAVHYDRVRMSHDFARNPRPGAHGRVLDPRDPDDPTVGQGDKPNADWVRWAFDAHKAREAAVTHNYKLGVVPRFPRVMAGFSHPELVPYEMTPALMAEIARHMHRPVKYVETLDPATRDVLGRTHWNELFNAPGENGNDTGLYLIDQKFLSSMTRAARVYEDFRGMTGVESWNPARDIRHLSIPSPADRVISREELEALAEQPGNDNDEALSPALAEVVERVRAELSYAAGLFDQSTILDMLVNPDKSFSVGRRQDLIGEIGEDNAVEILRDVLKLTRPHVLDYVTREDLLAAAKNEVLPIMLSRMVPIQVLYRDLRIPPENSFRFGPQELGRDRLWADLWPGDWAANRPARNSQKRKKRHVSG